MRKTYLLKLASRNLLTHKLRAVLTLMGIVIGVSSIVFLISFGAGIQQAVTERISGEDAFKMIDVGTGNSQVVKFNQELVDKITRIPGVSQVERNISLAGRMKIADNSVDIALFGTTPTYLEWLGKRVRYGFTLPDQSATDRAIVINTALLDFINKDNPDKVLNTPVTIDLVIPKELTNNGEPFLQSGQTFTVVGVIKDDAPPTAFVNNANLDTANILYFSQVKLMVEQDEQVDAVRKQIEAMGLKTQYLGDVVAQVQQVFNVFKVVLGSVGVVALFIALLGMFNTLTISLLERTKEVALMKILGMVRKDIRQLFIVEALLLGLVGGVIGVVWGKVLTDVTNAVFNHFSTRSGGEAVQLFYTSPVLIIAAIVTSLLVGLATGMYPAFRAANVKELDALRYE